MIVSTRPCVQSEKMVAHDLVGSTHNRYLPNLVVETQLNKVIDFMADSDCMTGTHP